MIEAKQFREALSRPMTDAEIELLCDSEIRCAMMMHSTCVTVALPTEAAARAVALYESVGWSVQIRLRRSEVVKGIGGRCCLRFRLASDLPLLATMVGDDTDRRHALYGRLHDGTFCPECHSHDAHVEPIDDKTTTQPWCTECDVEMGGLFDDELWPRCLTWSDEQVAEVERWLADSTAEMPEVLRSVNSDVGNMSEESK